MISSTHNHSTGSDGEFTPEELVKKAISLNWDYIYFTDHYTTHPDINTTFGKTFFSKDYLNEIKRLKLKYQDKIKIYFGVELDWLEEYKDWHKKKIKKYDFDYILGSIHRLKYKEGHRGMEKGKDYWIESAKIFGGVKKYIQEYYKQIRLIIKSGIYDAIGHLDYIKIYNKKGDLFNENEDWYKKEILKCLDLIKKHNLAIEINHGGIRKCGTPFPSPWILKKAKKRNIPITLGLDGHYKENYDNKNIKELMDIAKKAGYNEVVRFEKRKMIKEKLK
tara:strand:- start:10157 stop:10987 length:831 start_codon:yes stop_codon:yes gene_type:complete